MKTVTVEQIAEICHNANRAYQKSLGEEGVSWERAPKGIKDSVIAGVAYRLNNPLSIPDGQHDNWLKDKIKDGFTFGEKKSIKDKTHPCILPYAQLPEEQRIKDELFVAIVDTFKNRVEPFEIEN